MDIHSTTSTDSENDIDVGGPQIIDRAQGYDDNQFTRNLKHNEVRMGVPVPSQFEQLLLPQLSAGSSKSQISKIPIEPQKKEQKIEIKQEVFSNPVRIRSSSEFELPTLTSSTNLNLNLKKSVSSQSQTNQIRSIEHSPLEPGQIPSDLPALSMSTDSSTTNQKNQNQGTSQMPILNFQCNLCGKRFLERRYLATHMSGPCNEDRQHFSCSICGKQLTSLRNLRNHEETAHSDIRKHRCLVIGCGKSFKYKCDLDRHNREHTGELFGPCPRCGRRFNSKGNFNKHVKSNLKSCIQRQQANQSTHSLVSGLNNSGTGLQFPASQVANLKLEQIKELQKQQFHIHHQQHQVSQLQQHEQLQLRQQVRVQQAQNQAQTQLSQAQNQPSSPKYANYLQTIKHQVQNIQTIHSNIPQQQQQLSLKNTIIPQIPQDSRVTISAPTSIITEAKPENSLESLEKANNLTLISLIQKQQHEIENLKKAQMTVQNVQTSEIEHLLPQFQMDGTPGTGRSITSDNMSNQNFNSQSTIPMLPERTTLTESITESNNSTNSLNLGLNNLDIYTQQSVISRGIRSGPVFVEKSEASLMDTSDPLFQSSSSGKGILAIGVGFSFFFSISFLR